MSNTAETHTDDEAPRASISLPLEGRVTHADHTGTDIELLADHGAAIGTRAVVFAKPRNGHSSDVTSAVVTGPRSLRVAHEFGASGRRVWIRLSSLSGQTVKP